MHVATAAIVVLLAGCAGYLESNTHTIHADPDGPCLQRVRREHQKKGGQLFKGGEPVDPEEWNVWPDTVERAVANEPQSAALAHRAGIYLGIEEGFTVAFVASIVTIYAGAAAGSRDLAAGGFLTGVSSLAGTIAMGELKRRELNTAAETYNAWAAVNGCR
jgi:hypothetical protein